MRTTIAALTTLALACSTPGAVIPRPVPGLEPPLAWGDLVRPARIRAAAVELEPKLEAFFARARVPGMALGIVVDGELVWFKGMGVRQVAGAAPVDEDTVFRIASMSKAFVSAAVLRLRDEGKLGLDDPVEKHLPELQGLTYLSADSPRVTVRHLLSHASGLPEDNASADLRMPMAESDFARLLAAGLSFSSTPGTQFEYSNLGFALAGRLVGRVSGERLQAYVSRHLLAPLGMEATTWDAGEVPGARQAHGYGRRGSDMPSSGLAKYADDAFHEEPVLLDGAWAPIGGLWTSPRDYARWVAFQLAAWPPRDGADVGPVRRASLREAQEVQRAYPLAARRDGEGRLQVAAGGYGLGWSVRTTCSFSRMLRHSGGLPGYGSHVALLPHHGVGVFSMTNLTYTDAGEAVGLLLEGLLARGLLPERPVVLSPQLARARGAVLELMGSWNKARAAALFDVNYESYEPLEALQARLEGLRRAQGTCRPAPEVEPENALRGRMWLACDRGAVELSVELTSDVPARIQALVLAPALPPGQRLVDAASRAAALLSGWDDGVARGLLAGTVDLDGIRKNFARVAADHGPCAAPRPRKGDGASGASFRLRCERGEVDLEVGLDGVSGRISSVTLGSVPGTLRCPR
jgi:CubicO group peptidase (beta-lactamase class C family)